jgi:hypothetical protein
VGESRRPAIGPRLAHMDFIYGMACGVLGMLLAQGLALAHAWWSLDRKAPKCPVPEDINPSSR